MSSGCLRIAITRVAGSGCIRARPAAAPACAPVCSSPIHHPILHRTAHGPGCSTCVGGGTIDQLSPIGYPVDGLPARDRPSGSDSGPTGRFRRTDCRNPMPVQAERILISSYHRARGLVAWARSFPLRLLLGGTAAQVQRLQREQFFARERRRLRSQPRRRSPRAARGRPPERAAQSRGMRSAYTFTPGR